MRESWDTMNIKTEMTVENFNYSNVEKCISDFSHVDKVRFGVYCAELVIDIYEKYNLSKAPRQAIESAKKWIESTTEENKKACKSDDARVAAADAALDARVAASAARVAADSFSAAAAANAAALVAAADDAASAAALAASAARAADAASDAASSAGESIKENIVNWLNSFNSKNIEITVENFNYSNVKEWISDFSHADKVRFAVYCAELVIDIYEKYNLSKAPRQAIESAKKWIESTTEENKKACKSDDARVAAADAALDARVAASAARVAADSFSAAAAANAAALVAAADDAASAAALAASAARAADAASDAASSAGESIKENIVNWLNEFNSKNIETPEEKEALESISGKITIDIERYKELCGFEREIKIRDLMK